MANESGQEKTLEPTQKKIDEAHEKGDFARSKEIPTVVTFLAVLVFFWLGHDYLIGRVLHSANYFFSFNPFLDISRSTISYFLWTILLHLVPILLPILGIVVAAGLAAEFSQVGFSFRKDPFEPKWERLNPIPGLQKIFSLKQGVEGLKSTIKLVIFSYITYLTLRNAIPQIAMMNQNTPRQALDIMLGIGLQLGFRTCGLLLLFCGFDYWFQRWQYIKQLRMTHQELKEELRQQEGDPVLKARIRSIQMEIARKRMMTAVPESDVIITNPTHYAIAIKYDPAKDSAPVVVAKGQNYIAQRIREVAIANGVPIVENPPIARMLYKKIPIGGAIPASLFKAVAQILASIWSLSKQRGRKWATHPQSPAAVSPR